MENKEFLKDLLRTPSPSGGEKKIIKEVFNPHMSKFSKHEMTDNMYNSVFSVHNSNFPVKQKVLISGHIDSIGLMVTGVLESGLLSVTYNGRIDKKALVGSIVDVILDNNKIIQGVIGKKPIHVERKDDPELKMEDLSVDLGLSKEEVENLLICPGTLIIYRRNYLELGGNKICSPDLDDKIGVYITSEVLRRLNPENALVFGAAFTQEEVGLRGSYVAARVLNADISIDIDVTFETKDSGLNINEYGNVELGKGPVLEYGADKNRDLNNTLRSIAKENNIPLQIVAAGPGGTNTDAIQLGSRNCITTHLAIPLKNMHTPVEIINEDDVENCIKLIVKYIESL